jgi:hypothetical protein
MRNLISSLFPALVLAATLLASCNSDSLWGSRDNPVDPSAGNYQGYATVSSSADIRGESPTDGGNLRDILLISKVEGATAYELKIAASAAALDSSPLFDKADYADNVMNVSAAPMATSTKYYWRARAKTASGWDPAWSPVASFSTHPHWPWTEHYISPNAFQNSIASSADGRHLATAGYGVSTSADSGGTWVEQSTWPISGWWDSIVSSTDGNFLAICYYGTIMTSNDAGVSWTEPSGFPGGSEPSMAASADCAHLVVADKWGAIYTSSDFGATWVNRLKISKQLYSAASSSDGSRLAAVAYGGDIWTSANSGAAWIDRSAAGSRNWQAIASSIDGSRLAAVVYGGDVWTSSNSGADWTDRTAAGTRNWQAIVSSADGSHLAAVVSGGDIWTSMDSGLTWSDQASAGSRDWRSIASSEDGTRLAAVVNAGNIWTGVMAP